MSAQKVRLKLLWCKKSIGTADSKIAGTMPLHGTTQEFATLIAKDYDFWGKAIRDAGIKVDQ